MNISRSWFAAVGLAVLIAPAAQGQAVAFVPGVAAFPNGVVMSTTPVVSYDRRYVRLGMMPQFTALEGFQTYQVPAAVTGGGGGGLAGVGGLGGVTGFAGMNGPIDGSGMGSANFPTQLDGSVRTRPSNVAMGSGDFEDQVWPASAPPGKPALVRGRSRTQAKARTGRSAPTEPASAKPTSNRGPIKVKRTR